MAAGGVRSGAARAETGPLSARATTTVVRSRLPEAVDAFRG
jgi:hypothetical protein